MGHRHAGGGHDQPLSSCRRILLGFQISAWNVATIGSLVVVTVFWTTLVRNWAACCACTYEAYENSL